MKNHLLALLFLFAFNCSYAQLNNCGSNHFTQQLKNSNPDLLEKKIFPSHEKDYSHRIIPVVFHILHQNGNENINDQQVFSAMTILNNSFNMDNPDLSYYDPSFHSIIADCNIEFRLATLDPDGNCTNGIEHIYTSETNDADDWSKVNPWPRNMYLNIWVVNSIAFSGVSGYTYMPQFVNDASLAHLDGVLTMNDYIGSVGTASPNTGRAIVHEVGHWLGLQHTWGEGDQGQSCGDDGISDTPETKGNYACSQNSPLCNEGVLENIENFMTTPYCSGMFTNGQADLMHATLTSETAERNNLWQESNLIATGTFSDIQTCLPIAYFYPNSTMIGPGMDIIYQNSSWNAPVDFYQWSFPGGTPSSSTLMNPTVTYEEESWYGAQLIVGNEGGTDTLNLEYLIHVSPEWSDFFGPDLSTFDDETAGWWIIQNPEDENNGFELTPETGVNGTDCYAVENFYTDDPGRATTSETYYNMLGKTKEIMISPSYYLNNTSGINISFDFAGAYLTADAEKISKSSLKVYSSRDYGKTWNIRKTFTGNELNTLGTVTTEQFIPTSNDWHSANFSYTSVTPADNKTRFKIEYIPADSSNNFYIDNFSVNGILDLSEQELSNVMIYPNPVTKNGEIIISGLNENSESTITITDVKGSILMRFKTQLDKTVFSTEIPSGCYFVNVSNSESSVVRKIIIQ